MNTNTFLRIGPLIGGLCAAAVLVLSVIAIVVMTVEGASVLIVFPGIFVAMSAFAIVMAILWLRQIR